MNVTPASLSSSIARTREAWDSAHMLLLAAALAAAQPALRPAVGRTAWIFATVHQSEWCPAGSVRVDVRTGAFAITPGAPRRLCNRRGLERPVEKGRLGRGTLAAVREAYMQAVAQGLERPECREGRRPSDIVITNGGPAIIVVETGRESLAAPDDQTCWSHAANAVHETLEEAFRSYRKR